MNSQARPVPTEDPSLPPHLTTTVAPQAPSLGLSSQPRMPWGRKPSLPATASGLCYSCCSGYIFGFHSREPHLIRELGQSVLFWPSNL